MHGLYLPVKAKIRGPRGRRPLGAGGHLSPRRPPRLPLPASPLLARPLRVGRFPFPLVKPPEQGGRTTGPLLAAHSEPCGPEPAVCLGSPRVRPVYPHDRPGVPSTQGRCLPHREGMSSRRDCNKQEPYITLPPVTPLIPGHPAHPQREDAERPVTTN